MNDYKKQIKSSINTFGVGLFVLGINTIASSSVTPAAGILVILGATLIVSYLLFTLYDGLKGNIYNAVSSIAMTALLDVGIALLGIYQYFSPFISVVILITGTNLITLHFGLVFAFYFLKGKSF